MRDLQDKVKKFTESANLNNPPHIAAMDTVAELGEVVAEIIKASDYGKKKFVKTQQLESEMGDVLYSLITMANAFGVDLDKALDMVLEKYSKRLQEKGNAGSGE